MRDLHNPFVTKSFLRSVWALDYEAYKDSEDEKALLLRLRNWSKRADLKETSAESALLDEFFKKTWGYSESGQKDEGEAFSLYPKFQVKGAGAGGGKGEADAALGHFKKDHATLVPQVLCEFKDIKSSLDAPQKRKGNTRSPVKQGLDYLAAARRDYMADDPVLPTWAIITDMNEFRLYWADRGHQQFMRFTIQPKDLFQGQGLLGDGEDARFDRFLFARLFHRDTLLVQGLAGKSPLAQIISQQWVRERKLESEFYAEYRAFRDNLYQALLESNPEGTDRFPGTKGRLVRLAQKILDRCLFVFFCEDMGGALGFPPQLLRDFLIYQSRDPYFDPNGGTVWEKLLSLFRAMNDGSAFGEKKLNKFNGGLFAADPELERLRVPNKVFCQQGQGQNEASLYAFKLTLLYLSASYNYASGWAEGLTNPPVDQEIRFGDPAKQDPSKSLGLYTLGRIFEQSITELEILEAEADGRPSLNQEGKRKRDGVYYTPEWVVEHIVSETVGSRIHDLKIKCGWPAPSTNKLPTEDEIKAFEEEFKNLKIVDPACGSGAFLITVLRFLVDEWRATQEVRKQVSKDFKTREGEMDAVIRDILRENIYGVDINPASVELTKLALWLHTARGDKPLSSLDAHIREGNSLIDKSFYVGLLPYDAEEQERINAFDWKDAFPEVEERGGFDAVVGNPPYVKLQNFRKVHADVAGFLKTDRAGNETYASTQSGNFDLYLPFIEKGIQLLNDNGRLGYIAPSLWIMNEYGDGLRKWVAAGRHLYGWIDFQSFQVFDEATTYTALQFFSKSANDGVKVAYAPKGVISDGFWSNDKSLLSYQEIKFGDRWLLATGQERKLISKLYNKSRRLDASEVTTHIFQGLITSKDFVYHLKKKSPGHYICAPTGDDAAPPYEVEIEDSIMRPLVSGPEAKRYIDPETDTYLLFPYQIVAGGKVTLLSEKELKRTYPSAWKYLRSWEKVLRAREDGAFDCNEWYQFGRPQNLDKQETEKLIVAQTVPSMRVCADRSKSNYLNNVRVNGILPAKTSNIWYLLGVLNSPVCNFVFRRIAKPKDGGYFEANKQFIGPLPIANAAADKQTRVAELALRLQNLHTQRRDALTEISRRSGVLKYRNRPEMWLFPTLKSKKDLEGEAPGKLGLDARKAWASQRYQLALDARLSDLGANLAPGASLDAEFTDGELKFFIGGHVAIDKIFLPEAEGEFIAAQWKVLASTYSVTEKTDGKKFANVLRKIGESGNAALVTQIIERQQKLAEIEAEIAKAEAAVNALVYALYGLNAAEISIVEGA
ncbi:restriction endonuclease subunit M [Rhizobium sp. M10]|uniref:Eco57I restriction-modification methylase domain-containing protein n=1 Tax=Rhizobium sp. M10 TaxID=1324586 RepID=UPI000BE8A1A7|nr:N-6 DNA methylase [Rhizobium sp. M10]PDT31113.1 restriction endonuclease subunit M [Rhizobium sp. M10]